MQVGQTNLQEQRQNEQTANNMLAAAPASINPNNANVDPWQGVRDSANEYIKTSRTVTPPSEGEIHKRMWESSMMTGLIITLATGNVAGGLAAGMWGAVAVHDYGYTLRQRAEHVPQLQAEGYSMPAILKWYEDGDNSELDKERTEKEKAREFDLGRQDRNDQFRESQDEKVREFNAGQQLSREQMANQKTIARMQINAADRRARENSVNKDHSGGLRGPALAEFIVKNGVMPDGSTPTLEMANWAGWANNSQNKGGKISLTSPDPKANMTNKQALQQFRTANKNMSDVLGKTAQAEARLNSLDTTTPIGQLAAEYQFLTVEAPTIGNNVATAAGVTDEAVHGWADKVHQIQQKANMQGGLTQQDVDELKAAAHQEFAAIRDLQYRAAKAMADRYDLSDPTTAAMVQGATGYVDSPSGGGLAIDEPKGDNGAVSTEKPKEGEEHTSAGGVKFTVTKTK